MGTGSLVMVMVVVVVVVGVYYMVMRSRMGMMGLVVNGIMVGIVVGIYVGRVDIFPLCNRV